MVNLTWFLATASLTLMASTAIAQESPVIVRQPNPAIAAETTQPLSGASALAASPAVRNTPSQPTPNLTLAAPLQIKRDRSLPPVVESDRTKIIFFRVPL
jgi:hypothetical protein